MNFWYWTTHQFSAEAGMAYRTWYLSLEQPFFAPPPATFGIAWGIIYPLMAIAFLWTLYLWRKGRLPQSFVVLFGINILLNLSFSPVLLATQNNIYISATIVLVLSTLLWLQVWAWKRARGIFWLLLPYLLWGTFATILQLTLTVLN